MKNNNSKKFNLYTQGQRLAARVLLVVWLLGISSPQRALAGGTSPSLWNASKVTVLGMLWALVEAQRNLPSVGADRNLPAGEADWDLASLEADWNLASVGAERNLASVGAERNLASVGADWDLASVGAERNLASVGAEGKPLVRCLIEKDGTCSAPSRRSLNGYRNTEYNEEYLERIFSKLSPKQKRQVRKKIRMLESRQSLSPIDALSRALEKLRYFPEDENSADLPSPTPAPKTSADLPSPTPVPAMPADLPPPPPADNEEQVGDDESASTTMPAAPVVNLEDVRK